MTERLTPDEDSTLRALHWLEAFGAELSATFDALKTEIRARDLREHIREPQPEAFLLPAEAAQEVGLVEE